jgi:thioredoxin-dependent peroxiredoxin
MFVRSLLSLPVLLALVACNPSSTSPAPAASASASSASATPPPATVTSGATPTATAGLKEGDPAPDVEMAMQDGRKVKLSSLKGQLVVVYFYPKDQTQGCTIEAQNFRDRFDDLKKANIAVIGVSTQDAASHKAFIEKEKLPFDLAVDEDKSLARAFGVPLIGPGLHARQTFLIGKDGTVKKIWRDVKPKDHADEVLNASKA